MANKKSLDYQTLSTELDAVMVTLQSEDLSIDEAVEAYERGMHLIENMQVHLHEAENKVKKIKAEFISKK